MLKVAPIIALVLLCKYCELQANIWGHGDHGNVALMAGFRDLKGLSQPKYFYDSVIFRELKSPGYLPESQEQGKPREKCRCRPLHIYKYIHLSMAGSQN